MDKITSLVIGLSSRLAKASLLPAGQQDEKLQVIEVTFKVVKIFGKEQRRTKLFLSRKLTFEEGESLSPDMANSAAPC